MNILYRACASKMNYQLNLLEILRKKEIFEKCTVISQTLDHGDCYPEKFYHEIKAGHGYHASYNAICNYDALPAVPKSVWQEMLPYKSTIMDTMCRIYNIHLMTYDEMEMLYVKHVRFWHWVLTSDHIGFCFFATVPHTAWEYTVYALAKIKKIPTLLISEQWIPELCSVATDLSNIGNSAAVCYKLHEKIGTDEAAHAFYNKILKDRIVSTKKEKKDVLDSIDRWCREHFHKPVSKTIIKRAEMKKRFREGNDPYITIRTIWNCDADIKYNIRQHIFDRKLKRIEYYESRLAGRVSLKKKYILFPMQYTPESTTLPQAGVFSNQLLTLQLLAEAAGERGIRVYVKEHWTQRGRMQEFYNELSAIPNVYFAKSSIDNDILIEHAYMVASQTGTCILEAFIRCIPCLSFAYSAVSEAPGVYYVSSKEEILNAIDTARKKRPTAEEAKKYFASICKTSVRTSLDWKENGNYSIQEYSKDVVDLITDYTEKGMPDDYYYENKNLKIKYF